MKRIGIVFMVMIAFVVTSMSALAADGYIVVQDCFLSETLDSGKWDTSVSNPGYGQVVVQEAPDNPENKCLSVELLRNASGLILSQALLKESYGAYFTANFKMRLHLGDTGLTEYAGVYLQYKSANDFLALQWSRRVEGAYQRIALVKNGYEAANVVLKNSASGFQEGWDPEAWTDFKIVCAGSKVLIYVNGADEPCITYNENTHTDGRFGFFNRGMYVVNSRLYVDDISIENQASVMTGASVVCGENNYTCDENTAVGSRFVDSVNVNFARQIKNAVIKLTDEDKKEIPCEQILNESGTQLTAIPKAKLGNGKKYYVDFESVTTSDDDVLLSVPPVSFLSAKDDITITPTLAGQTVSIVIEKETDISNVYIYAAHYKNGVLAELIPTLVPTDGNPEDIVFTKNIDETSDVKIYSFGGERFERIITEPVNCID